MIMMMNESFEEKVLSPKEEGLVIIGKMASGIMHDVNNVFTTIQGYVTLLKIINIDDQAKEYVEVIQKCILDGKEIINRLRKLNVNKKYTVTDINIYEQITSVIKMTKPIWHDDALVIGKKISLSFDGDESIYIYGNENELREALINIVMNSVDAIDKEGKIEIKSFKNQTDAVIAISDTGCGIERGVIDKIFEPFFTTKGEMGNGLGLSMVKEIIDRMNGTINVNSEIGKGTTIFIKLPLCEKQIKEKPERFINELARELRVLIVDDQKEVREVIKEMVMTLKNISAYTASSCSMAFLMMKKEKYDLIISDMIMPDINGIEFIKLGKELYPETKYVLMTGCISNEEPKGNVMADYVLHKPFTIEEIRDMLWELYINKDIKIV